MNKNEKLEINYNEGLVEEKKEAWMDNLAKLLTNIEALEKLQEKDKSLVNKRELHEIISLYKIMNLMLINDQWKIEYDEPVEVRRLMKVKKFIPNYILDINNIDRVVSGGLFTELNIWILPANLIHKAIDKKTKAILYPEQFGLPGFDKVNYATLQPLGMNYMALSKDNGIFNDYIKYSRNMEYVTMNL